MAEVATKLPTIGEMAAIWNSGIGGLLYNIHVLVRELRKTNPDILETPEIILLIGTYVSPKERLEAELMALAPGLVVCNLQTEAGRRYCSGLVTRRGLGYQIQTFAEFNGELIHGSAWIDIFPDDLKDAAAGFYWGFGPDQGSKIGINARRWAEIRPWLEGWLGPVK